MADLVYSLKQIEGVQSQLRDFAKTPRTRFSKKQAVEALIDDIEAALQAHPYDEVAEKLKEWGIDIAAGSLKQYVNAYRREHGNETASPAGKRSGKKAKKKTVVDESNDETADKTSAEAELVNSKKSTVNGSTGNTAKPAKRASNRTPDGFLEMAEDL